MFDIKAAPHDMSTRDTTGFRAAANGASAREPKGAIRRYNRAMRRTRHIAVRVPSGAEQAAQEFYSQVMGLVPDGTGLKGENFTLYIDPGMSPTVVLQEFVGKPEDKEKFLHAGCEVFDESEFGFHVRDPFGMCFHVWTKDGGEAPD